MQSQPYLRQSLYRVLLFASLMCGLLLAGCGQAPVDENAVATQAAATIYAEQTAQAKAWTPTPTATVAPSPTATQPPTPTPAPTRTPTPAATRTPTPTSEPLIAPSLGEGLTCAKVFEENFEPPSRDWPSGNDRYSRWGPNQGEYQIQIREADYYYLWSNGLRAADFVLEMDAHQTSDNFGAYGLVFGLNSLDDGQDFYAFFVDAEGYFALFKHTDDQWTTLVEWTYTPALLPGKGVNRLRVERREETISLSANGQPLITTQDSSYMRQRYVALIAETFDVGDVDVRFDNIVACLSPTWPPATPTPVVDVLATPTAPPPPPPTATPPPPPPTATPAPPPPAPDIPAGKGRLVMLNCRGDVITVDVIPVGVFQELAPKTGPDCKPGEPIILDPGQYILRASIAGVPSLGEATINIMAGMTLNFTWY